jgi:hypothetical protein
MNPETQAAGTKAASEARARRAAEQEALAHPDLSTPERIREYLELVTVAVVTGAIPSDRGRAASTLCNSLLKAHELSITKRLDELIKAQEAQQRTQHQTGVVRHRR